MTGSASNADVGLWVERIRVPMRKTVGGVFALGKVLIQAKQALPHGEYLSAVKIAGLEPRVAQMLHANSPEFGTYRCEISFVPSAGIFEALYVDPAFGHQSEEGSPIWPHHPDDADPGRSRTRPNGERRCTAAS